ncbi:hypothetical protein [Methylobacterium sp.]|nr:hypothetical protein [Methylobacterium sp.]
MTRTREVITIPRRSLFQASAVLRFIAAALLTGLLWAAILWASQ